VHDRERPEDHFGKFLHFNTDLLVFCAGVEKVHKVHKRVHGLCNIRAATAPGQGGGVLDRPTLDKPTPGRESEFDLK